MILWLASIHVLFMQRHGGQEKKLDSVYLMSALTCDAVLEMVALAYLLG